MTALVTKPIFIETTIYPYYKKELYVCATKFYVMRKYN